MSEKFNPGDHVFIVLRNRLEDPVEVTGYIFITCVNGVAFAAPVVNGHRDVEFLLCYLQNLTQDDEELPLVAVPVEDCYPTREAAKEAMKYELEN